MASTAPATGPKPIRMLSLLKRNPHLTLEAFHAHWSTTHAKIFAPFALKHGFTYRQIRSRGIHNGQAFDGIVEFEITDMERFKAAFMDPYYIDVIEVDERVILDKSAGKGGTGIVGRFTGEVWAVVEAGEAVFDGRSKL